MSQKSSTRKTKPKDKSMDIIHKKYILYGILLLLGVLINVFATCKGVDSSYSRESNTLKQKRINDILQKDELPQKKIMRLFEEISK